MFLAAWVIDHFPICDRLSEGVLLAWLLCSIDEGISSGIDLQTTHKQTETQKRIINLAHN
jgi:hypothetical protein